MNDLGAGALTKLPPNPPLLEPQVAPILTRDKVAELHKLLKKTLDEFAASQGMEAHLGGSTFTINNIRIQLELSVVDHEGQALTREAEDFFHLAHSYGLCPKNLGQTFLYQGQTYKITGLRTRNPSYPIMVEDETGKGYKFPAELVKRLLTGG